MKSGDLESMTTFSILGQQSGLGSAGQVSTVSQAALPQAWLALGWGEVTTGLHVCHHPAGKPGHVHTRERTVAKSSRWASEHPGRGLSSLGCVTSTEASMANASAMAHADSGGGQTTPPLGGRGRMSPHKGTHAGRQNNQWPLYSLRR